LTFAIETVLLMCQFSVIYVSYQLSQGGRQDGVGTRKWTGVKVKGTSAVEKVAFCAVDVPVTLRLIDYYCCTTPICSLTFTVRLRRKPLYYVMNLVLPCGLFSIIAVVTFVLPPASGERVGIG